MSSYTADRTAKARAATSGKRDARQAQAHKVAHKMPCHPTTFCPFYMKLLELFSGSGSMGKAFAEKGWEVTSLDLDPKTEATIKQHI